MRRKFTLLAVGLAGLLALAPFAGEARGQPPRSQPERLRLSAWEAEAIQTLHKARTARQREEALRALARSREAKLAPVIAHYAAYDLEYSVREAASHALARMRHNGTRYTPPDYPRREERGFVDDEFDDDRRKVREVEDAVEELRTARKAYRREDAARALGEVGGPGVIRVLAHAAAYDPDSTVRHVANQAVERIRKRAARWEPPPPPRYEYDRDEDDRPDRGRREVDPNAELIEDAVVHYLRRNVEPRELRDWQAHFRRGGTYDDMLATFLGAEGYVEEASNDPARYVTRLYVDVLRRHPSGQEVRTWVAHWRNLRGDYKELARLFVKTSHQERRQRSLPY